MSPAFVLLMYVMTVLEVVVWSHEMHNPGLLLWLIGLAVGGCVVYAVTKERWRFAMIPPLIILVITGLMGRWMW